MNKFLALILLVFLIGTVNALVDTHYPYFPKVASVELKSDSDYEWSNYISANDGDSIDIKATIFVSYDYYKYPYYESVSNPYDKIQVWAEIYADGYYIKKTSTKTYHVYQLNSVYPKWSNEFYADDSYSNYEVVVHARSALDYSNHDYESAYINDINPGYNSYCSDIEIDNKTIAMNENESRNYTFTVRNNSEERFNYSGSPYVYNVLGRDSDLGIYSYDNSIAAGDTGQITVKVRTPNVSQDEEEYARLQINGSFPSGKSCSGNDIEKEFKIIITNSAGYEDCSDIVINASDERMLENDSDVFSFNVRNYSDNGFYVDDFDPYVVYGNSFISATEEYKPSFIPANSSKDFEYRVVSNSVSGNSTGKITLRVSGHYSGGRTCSYSTIGEKIIDLTIKDVSDSEGEGYCSDLSLNTRNLSLNENDVYSTSFSVENNSDTRFNITGISFNESNTSVDFRNVNYNSYISAGNTTNVSFTAETESVSSTKNIPVYFEVKGRFENGRTCSFSDARERFDVEIRNDGSGSSASCSGIDVITETVNISQGETKTIEFSLENNESRRFYVDYVNVYDNDSKITSEETFYSSSIPANSKGTIRTRIKGLNTGTATVYIEIRGHFDNGSTCSVNDIGKESFNVRIGTTSSGTDTCSDFVLDVPSSKSILGKEKIVLRIDNPLNKTGTIRISGTNLSVSPYTISIPKNSSFTETIEVELLEGKESYLVYNISLEGCTVRSKTTKIFTGQENFEVVDYPAQKEIALNDSISFTLRNNTASSKEFNVSLQGLPSNWNINEKSVVIPANSDRTISIELEAENSGTYNAVLVVESGGRKIEKEIQLTVKEENIQVTAETTQGILNEKELKITIENNTQENIQGNIIVELPEGWTMEGNTAVKVNAKETKVISFKLKTDGTDKTIPVRVELDNGKNFFAEAENKTTGTTTALVSLGQNLGVVLGLLVIVIIIVILLARR
ncbi:hypothetical protein KKB11_07245 [Candidatus Micrarchaeota archaeon]|nr:hypothetical protein [Candidatus Micrarchaeota archaeon]